MDERTDADVAEAKSVLREALMGLAVRYDEIVRETGRERQEEWGADFNVSDFLAGAAVIFKMVAEDDNLPWPVTEWVLWVLTGRNPLWPDGKGPEQADLFRQQWLVVAVPPRATYAGWAGEVIASFSDGQEAAWLAAQCNELRRYRSGDLYQYLRVQVPGLGYENRRDFADVWAAVEEEE